MSVSHIHWYERLYPLGTNGTIDHDSVLNNNIYYTNPGKSITHIVNGMAGNIESHSTFGKGQGITDITAVLDMKHYGFSKIAVISPNMLQWTFVRGDGAGAGDELVLIKRDVWPWV